MIRLQPTPFLLAVLLLIVGCDSNSSNDGPETVTGPAVTLEGSTIQGWVRLDADDRPTAVGITVDEGAYEALSDTADTHSKHDEAVVVELALPDAAPAPYDHATLDWNPEGHPPPGIYTVPHFDVHFFFVTEETRENIPGGPATRFPDEQYLPTGYAPDSVNTPDMGMHYVNLQAPEFNGQPFTHTFIYGAYRGEITFIEPMVTTEVLDAGPEITAPVPQPEAVQQSGFYPTEYRIVHDEAAGEYRITLVDLTHRSGS
jgi:hypothetical protein